MQSDQSATFVPLAQNYQLHIQTTEQYERDVKNSQQPNPADILVTQCLKRYIWNPQNVDNHHAETSQNKLPEENIESAKCSFQHDHTYAKAHKEYMRCTEKIQASSLVDTQNQNDSSLKNVSNRKTLAASGTIGKVTSSSKMTSEECGNSFNNSRLNVVESRAEALQEESSLGVKKNKSRKKKQTQKTNVKSKRQGSTKHKKAHIKGASYGFYTGNKPLKCKECGEAFTTPVKLNTHFLVTHTNIAVEEYKCTHCDKEFTNATHLKQHESGSKCPNKRYICTKCNKSYSTPVVLDRHMNIHRGRNFTCTISSCNRQLTTALGLKRHMLIHTGVKPYSCSICNKSFRLASNLKKHQNVHTEERPYMCEKCGKTFKGRGYLYHHVKTHVGKKWYTCSECGKIFVKNSYLISHMMNSHVTKRTYLCSVCGKSFPWKILLNSHVETHVNEQPSKDSGSSNTKLLVKPSKNLFKCCFCTKIFSQSSELKSHMITHPHERLWICCICGKEFRDQSGSDLQSHMKTHVGEKLYVRSDDLKIIISDRHREHKESQSSSRYSNDKTEEVVTNHVETLTTVSHDQLATGGTELHPCQDIPNQLQCDENVLKQYSHPIQEDQSFVAVNDSKNDAEELICQNQVSQSLPQPNETMSPIKAASYFDHLGVTNDTDVCEAKAGMLSSVQLINEKVSENLTEIDNVTKSPIPPPEQTKVSENTSSKTDSFSDFAIDTELIEVSKPKPGMCNSVQQINKKITVNLKETDDFDELPRPLSEHTKVSGNTKSKMKLTETESFALRIGLRPHVCKECGKAFATGITLNIHLNTHLIPHKCPVCAKAFSLASSLILHMKMHTTPPILCVCPKCGKSYSSASRLNRHMKCHGERTFSCSVTTCSKKFLNVKELQRHMIIHTGEKNHGCSVCGKLFSLSANLKVHMRIHTGEKPHTCPICGKSFITTSDMKKHARIHSKDKPHKCSECSRMFNRASALRKHMRIHIEGTAQQCHQCGKQYLDRRSKGKYRNEHVYNLYKETQNCPDCVKGSIICCPICSKKFQNASKVRRHMVTHTGDKNYCCSVCGKLFSLARGLKLHMRIHTGERPHVCHMCGKSFRSSSDMKKHGSIHSEDRPHKCGECSKTFKNSIGLKRHMQIHKKSKT